MIKLSPERLAFYMDQRVVAAKATICRFMVAGRAIDIATGRMSNRGINVIYQTHYWNFTEETARQIAAELSVGLAGNPVQAVFSK